jgi:hypothetical protein
MDYFVIGHRSTAAVGPATGALSGENNERDVGDLTREVHHLIILNIQVIGGNLQIYECCSQWHYLSESFILHRAYGKRGMPMYILENLDVPLY